MPCAELSREEVRRLGTTVVLAIWELEKLLTVWRNPSKKQMVNGFLAVLHALRPGFVALDISVSSIPPYGRMRDGSTQSRALELRNLRFAALELLTEDGEDVGKLRTALISVWAKTIRHCLRLGYVLDDVLDNRGELREAGSASGRRRVSKTIAGGTDTGTTVC